jgi:hypothetical protein
MANKTDISRAALVVIATAGVIVFNWLAVLGYINNTAPDVISYLYPTIITPAGYAFSIWSLIYLGLIAFSIYQALPKNLERFRGIRTAYIFSCLLNCAWIYSWHHERMLACLVIIIALLATLLFINIKVRNGESYTEYWTVSAPFGIYFGWVTVAAMINFVLVLGSLGVTVTRPGATLLGVICVIVAVALGVIVRIKLTNYLYPLAIAWALTAIGVKQSGQTLIVAAAALGTVACLIAAGSFVVNLPSRGVQVHE